MAMKCKTDAKTRALVFYLRKNTSMSARDICGEAGISRSTLYRLLKLPAKVKESAKMGRPRKISVREERIIRRSIGKLRTTEGSFSTKTLMQEAGLVEPGVSKGTITRCLHRMGYKFLQARRKGRLSDRDRSDRFKFARKMKRNFKDSIWQRTYPFIWMELALCTSSTRVNRLGPLKAACGESLARAWIRVARPKGLTSERGDA